MPPLQTPRLIKIYRLLLHSFPGPFRQNYGELMTRHFADCYRLALRESSPAVMRRFWMESLVDLMHSALLERIEEMRASRGWLWPLAVCFPTLPMRSQPIRRRRRFIRRHLPLTRKPITLRCRKRSFRTPTFFPTPRRLKRRRPKLKRKQKSPKLRPLLK